MKIESTTNIPLVKITITIEADEWELREIRSDLRDILSEDEQDELTDKVLDAIVNAIDEA